MDEGGDNQRRGGELAAELGIMSLVGSGLLLLFAWNIINTDRPHRIMPFGVVVLAICLAMSFGLSFGAACRSRNVLRWLLLGVTIASGTLIVILATAGLASLLRD